MIDREKMASPRPDFYRRGWKSLNGAWKFAFDDKNIGIREGWQNGHAYEREITVPFCYQSRKSGIGETEGHPCLWYERDFSWEEQAEDARLWLNFGAVDYEAVVWINGRWAGSHRGGHTPFSVEITPFVSRADKTARVTVMCRDSYDTAQPRGKQHWNIETDRCWYTATSGIWQNVWMEITGPRRMEHVRLIPLPDQGEVRVKISFAEPDVCGEVRWKLKFEGGEIGTGAVAVKGKRPEFIIAVRQEDPIDNTVHLWSPEKPVLYDLELEYLEGASACDRVETYFGMRTIEVKENHVLLNHFPLYQRLVLDQGYWPDSLMTPPDGEALLKDLEMVRAMGFNGVRKHQKIEDPVFLYLADHMGILVGEEMPSNYEFCQEGMDALLHEYGEVIARDCNHPCIITWVPFNESWGIRNVLFDREQQHFAETFYHYTKALDPYRLVSTNDGWEAVKADFVGIHDYESDGEVLAEKFRDMEALMGWTAVGKMVLSEGRSYGGEPVFLSEFGGIAMEDGKKESWGYNEKAAGPEAFAERLSKLTGAVNRIGGLAGFCYTQLTDVEQETNGLLYADRTPKMEVDRIAACMTGEDGGGREEKPF